MELLKIEFCPLILEIMCWVKNGEISKSKFVIIPVPISDKRKKERKYNHMSLVATEFAKLTGYSINETLIRRIKDEV